MHDDSLLTIGAFAARARLSPKALRLYDRLGLLAPAHVDPATGYRWYRTEQVDRARLVVLLRQIEMPLARIADVLELPGWQAAEALTAYWAEVEDRRAVQGAVVAYLRDRLTGRTQTMKYEIRTVDVAEQVVLTERRGLTAAELPRWIPASLGRLEQAAEGCGGIAGPPYVVYHSEVTADDDGPVEACLPVNDARAAQLWLERQRTGAALRVEPAGRLAYTRITKAQVTHPLIESAFDAVERWTAEEGLTITGPCREVYFADWDASSATDEVCDVAFPVG
ncbi:MerR family DNA-binding transcriptional regulator [Streptomyces spongiicola]|uniref:MerR family DNA-binding transcriptional regulator n=1 Tax=Streptomyces spongiicola TaxID=1690221 RepID=A0A2S1Z162_9ACTN|nr:MerR family transcriptional regulator [Streptomyces spongiicola]AWK09658.1 MerR family transcriptional regulator [Streptomyces spongiicola]GBQ04003.1 MerR family DNA-binding transcriptional regulator [Streptomyces spongiicola]